MESDCANRNESILNNNRKVKFLDTFLASCLVLPEKLEYTLINSLSWTLSSLKLWNYNSIIVNDIGIYSKKIIGLTNESLTLELFNSLIQLFVFSIPYLIKPTTPSQLLAFASLSTVCGEPENKAVNLRTSEHHNESECKNNNYLISENFDTITEKVDNIIYNPNILRSRCCSDINMEQKDKQSRDFFFNKNNIPLSNNKFSFTIDMKNKFEFKTGTTFNQDILSEGNIFTLNEVISISSVETVLKVIDNLNNLSSDMLIKEKLPPINTSLLNLITDFWKTLIESIKSSMVESTTKSTFINDRIYISTEWMKIYSQTINTELHSK